MEIEILLQRAEMIIYEVIFACRKTNIIRIIQNETHSCIGRIDTYRWTYEEVIDAHTIMKRIPYLSEFEVKE